MKIKAFAWAPSQQPHSLKSGFTLIELMVVMALVALLAGLSIVGIQTQMKRSKERETSARIVMFKGLLESYVMADSFHHPIQYRRFDKNSDEELAGTYDMWSYGSSESGDDSEAAKKLWLKPL